MKTKPENYLPEARNIQSLPEMVQYLNKLTLELKKVFHDVYTDLSQGKYVVPILASGSQPAISLYQESCIHRIDEGQLVFVHSQNPGGQKLFTRISGTIYSCTFG